MGDALLSNEYSKYDLSSVKVISIGGGSIKTSVARELIKKYNLEWFRQGRNKISFIPFNYNSIMFF